MGEQLKNAESLRVADGIDSDVIASDPESTDFSTVDDGSDGIDPGTVDDGSDGIDPGAVASGPESTDFSAVDDGSDEIVRSTITSSRVPTDFSTADDSVHRSKTALEQASRVLRSIENADAYGTLSDLQIFDDELSDLRLAWDAFHDRYDNWRKSEGGCDRTAVIQKLDQFAFRIGDTRREVRNLPISADLLPIHTLMVEAIAMEENVVRTLHHTWQPFTVDPFSAVHRERIKVDRLRRDANVAVQELVGYSK